MDTASTDHSFARRFFHPESWPFWGSDANIAMLDEFVAAIREDREPAVTGVDGLRALEVVDAAYRSVESGEPVSVQRAE